MSDTTLVYLEDLFLEHDAGPGHPESPARLAALRRSLTDEPVPGTRRARGRAATREELLRVHDPDYLDLLDRVRGRSVRLDVDTVTSPASVDAATLAAGTAMAAVEAVMSGEARRAFVLPRPPGHHAERARAMGFCLLSTVAAAAAHAVAALGCRRVLVVDWDVHHGNGTQDLLGHRADVLHFDTHQWPLYPGTGRADETGRGAGAGYTINVPLPPGCGDAEYLAAFEELLVPAADAYAPDLVLVSAGFDAHRADPLAQMSVSENGFAALAGIVCAIAGRHAGGKVVGVLEGGYDPAALVASTRAVLDVFCGAPPPQRPPGSASDGARRVLDEVRRAHRGGPLLR